ncbi:hypothetical protein [Streptomyces sp. NPDC002845]
MGQGDGVVAGVGSQEPLPATASATTLPPGPVEAYAQASAAAVPLGVAARSQESASRADSRMARADRVRWGPCTTEIMEAAVPAHAGAAPIWSERGTTAPAGFYGHRHG